MKTYNECLAYVEHLRREHKHVHELLGNVTTALVNAENKRENSNVAAEALLALRLDLERHFAAEENGGCLEEVVCHCPGVASEARAIAAEHAVVRDELDRLIELAKGIGNADELHAVRTDFAAFSKFLMEHETRESRILQHGLGADAMDADVENFENG